MDMQEELDTIMVIFARLGNEEQVKLFQDVKQALIQNRAVRYNESLEHINLHQGYMDTIKNGDQVILNLPRPDSAIVNSSVMNNIHRL